MRHIVLPQQNVLVKAALSRILGQVVIRTQFESEISLVGGSKLDLDINLLPSLVDPCQGPGGVAAVWGFVAARRCVPGVPADAAFAAIDFMLSLSSTAESTVIIIIYGSLEIISPHGGSGWRVKESAMATGKVDLKAEGKGKQKGNFNSFHCINWSASILQYYILIYNL